ncbi:MAG: MFS transporter [Cyclobacteriaceae bacterium]|nr:MAG: MFS transporter [Cyclobacteriaceae bacterium]
MLRNLRAYLMFPASAGVGTAFVIMSVVFGTWITRIPDIKIQTGLTEGALGLALLGMPIGAITIMAFMGSLIHRFGVGRITWVSSLVYVVSLILPALATGLLSLTASLVVVGVAAGAMDVAMNAAAAAIEKQHKRLIMSTSHAMFSLGGMAGAGVGSVVVGFGISTLVHFIATAVLLLIVIAIVKKHWLAITFKQDGSHKWAWPGKSLALVAFIGFCVLLAEGAIADWSAIYIRETLGGSAILGGLGFAGFSLTMALGRFYGDMITPKFGAGSIVGWGSLIAVLALGILLVVGSPLAAILGFTLAGLGLSCVIPIVFSTAANIPGVSPGGGIASVSSMGYLGFMVGPPLIGFIAEEFGLSYGLAVVVVLCLLFGLASRLYRWS